MKSSEVVVYCYSVSYSHPPLCRLRALLPRFKRLDDVSSKLSLFLKTLDCPWNELEV